jgi:hypothetical protein
MNSSAFSHWLGVRALLIVGAVIVAAALAVTTVPLQTVGAPGTVAPSPVQHASHPAGTTGKRGAAVTAKKSAPRSAPAAETTGTLSGNRCWAYTQAGDSTAKIETLAQGLAASPCTVDSWVFEWRYLEPSPRQYDWQLVDAAIQDSIATGKTVTLRVLAGITSPSWISSKASMATVPSNGLTRAGVMPVPWNRGFLSAWGAFIKAFGARYDGNPNITMIETAGNGIYGETYLPGGTQVWDPLGYTEAKYLASTEAVVSQYVASFPHTRLALDVSLGVSGADQNVMMPLVTWVAQEYPTIVYAQQNGLSGTSPPGGQAVVHTPLFGLQMLGPTSESRTGNLCTAFTTALDDGAAYVEVYYSDATNPTEYPTLDYLINGDASATC